MGALVYNSVKSGLMLYGVDSPRARAMPDELDDILIEKMQEIDSSGFKAAYEKKLGNYFVGLANEACVALKIREKTNKNDGQMVEWIQKVGRGQKGYAWCVYQQQAAIGIAETLTGIRSLFPYTGSCAEVRTEGVKVKGLEIKREDLQYGDEAVKKYSNGTGHIACFKEWVKKLKTARTLEGNTTGGLAGEKVVREGGGSYSPERDLSDGTWIKFFRPFPQQGDALVAPVLTPKKGSTEPGEIPKYGEHSDNVATMQAALNSYGAKLLVDGKFGPKTKDALSKFQKSQGLPGSGVPGVKTFKLLGLS